MSRHAKAVAGLLAAVALVGCGADGPDGSRPGAVRTSLRLPLAFEASGGRADARFVAHGPGGALLLRDRGPRFLLGSGDRTGTVTIGLPGARRGLRPQAGPKLRGVVNSYVGPRREWREGLATFSSVRYPRVWPGTDLVFHGGAGQLEYDFVVAPDADPGRIAVRLRGARLTEEGALVVRTPGGRFVQRAPRLFQGKDAVDGRFRLDGDVVRFDVGAYDRARPLTIDPVIVYSTFNGGNGADTGYDIAVGADGQAVVVGETESTDFPLASPSDPIRSATEAFVTKLSGDGSARVFSTYLGGRGDDSAEGVSVSPGGRVAVTGTTDSPDFPRSADAADKVKDGPTDAFVSVIGPAGGQLLGSTYLGGDYDDGGAATMMRTDNSVEVAGTTQIGEAPTRASYTTYRGVDLATPATQTYASASANVTATDLARLSDGRVVLAGTVTGNDALFASAGQTTYGGGAHDAWVGVFTAQNLTRAFVSYHGGSGDETGPQVAVDAGDLIHLAGTTTSADLPTAAPADTTLGGSSDAFLARFTAAGTRYRSTYVGDTRSETGTGVGFAPEGGVWLTGTETQLITSGDSTLILRDALLWRLAGDLGAVAETTRLGGSGQDLAEGLASDPAGAAYLTGSTTSSNFPTLNAVQPTNNGQDAFVTKVVYPTPTPTATSTATQTATATATATPDTQPPDTSITGGPDGPVRGARQSFTFTATEPGSVFRCSIDAAPAAACAPGDPIDGLARGEHTFSVAAVDPAGNADPTPATRSFAVYATAAQPPDTVVLSGPDGPTGTTTASFAFDAQPGEPGVTFECSLDGAAFSGCASPQGYTGLAPGQHAFRVRLVDAGGVADPTPAQRDFVSGTATAPTATPDPLPQGDQPAPPVAVLPGLERVLPGSQFVLDGSQSTGAALTYAFDVDGNGSYERDTGSEPTLVASLPGAGDHKVGLRVVDRLGRTSTATATVSVAAPLPAQGASVGRAARIGQKVVFGRRGASTASRRVAAASAGAKAYSTFDFGDASKPDEPSVLDGRWSLEGRFAAAQDSLGHSFGSAGKYHYTTTRTDELGFTSSTQGDLYVNGKGIVPVEEPYTGTGALSLSTGPDYGADGPATGRPFTITLFNSAELDTGAIKVPNGTYVPGPPQQKKGVTVWHWGDGTPDTNTVLQHDHSGTHTYAKAGTYNGYATYKTDKEGTAKLPFTFKVRDPLCPEDSLDLGGGVKLRTSNAACLMPWGPADGDYVTMPGGGVTIGKSLTMTTSGTLVVDPKTRTVAVGPYDLNGITVTLGGTKVPIPQVLGKPAFSGITIPEGSGARSIPQLSQGTSAQKVNGLAVVSQNVTVGPGDTAAAALTLALPKPFTDTVTTTLGGQQINQRGLADGTFKLVLDEKQFGPVLVSGTLERDDAGVLKGGGSIKVPAVGDFLADYLPLGSKPFKRADGKLVTPPSGFEFGPQGQFRFAGFAFEADNPINIAGAFGLSKVSAKLALDDQTRFKYFQGRIKGVVPAQASIASIDICVQMQQMKAGESTIFCPEEGSIFEEIDPNNCEQSYVDLVVARLKEASPKDFEKPGYETKLRKAYGYFAKFLCGGVSTSDIDQFWMTVKGNVELFDAFPIYARFSYRNGQTVDRKIIDFAAGFNGDFGPIGVKAALGGSFLLSPPPKLWEIWGTASVSVASLLEVSGAVLANQTYLSGCGRVHFIGTIQLTAAILWDDPDHLIWGDNSGSCLNSVKKAFGNKLTNRSSAAQALAAQNEVPGVRLEGEPDTQVMVRGVGGPPTVELVGPDGTRIAPAPGLEPQDGDGWSSVEIPEANLTQIAISRPAKGNWTVRTSGPTAITQVTTAAVPQRAPIVRTKVTHKGRAYKLHYMIERAKGRSVRFYEVSPSGARTPLGMTKAHRGTLKMTPSLGRAETRKIAAYMMNGDLPEQELTVGSYRAPGLQKIGRPRRVKVRRRGDVVTVAFARGARAEQTEVLLRAGKGEPRRVTVGAKRRSARFGGVPATLPAKVEVRSLAIGGRRTAPVRGSVKAALKVPKRFVASARAKRS